MTSGKQGRTQAERSGAGPLPVFRRKKLIILGSTGSIGRSALEVVRHYPERFEVVGLAAHSNVELLAAQIAEFQPSHVAMADPEAASRIRELCSKKQDNSGTVPSRSRSSLAGDSPEFSNSGTVPSRSRRSLAGDSPEFSRQSGLARGERNENSGTVPSRSRRSLAGDSPEFSRQSRLSPGGRSRGTAPVFWAGPEGIEALAALGADMVLCAMVGAVGLRPLLAAIDSGSDIAVANKEPLVMAGPLVMARAREKGIQVLPVDSEHSAIFQCIHGHEQAYVRHIHLTASGGPFYGRTRESLRGVTPEQATRHPTWDMGAKISVDSATLMNKGLEIIEAMALFDLPEDRIEVVIHPQSVVHSLVEFSDGNILAHLGITDMKFPILFALTYPERVQSPMARLDLTSMPALTFAKPDFEEFPCLRYARQAAAEGGTAPAILNAANEEAVSAFCRGRIPFLAIAETIGRTIEAVPPHRAESLDAVLEEDARARRIAREYIEAVPV